MAETREAARERARERGEQRLAAITAADLDAIAEVLYTHGALDDVTEEYRGYALFLLPLARLWLGQQQRSAALEQHLRALVATEPTYDDEGVGTRCGYCGGRRRSLSVTTTTIDHKDACPWRAARKLLGE